MEHTPQPPGDLLTTARPIPIGMQSFTCTALALLQEVSPEDGGNVSFSTPDSVTSIRALFTVVSSGGRKSVVQSQSRKIEASNPASSSRTPGKKPAPNRPSSQARTHRKHSKSPNHVSQVQHVPHFPHAPTPVSCHPFTAHCMLPSCRACPHQPQPNRGRGDTQTQPQPKRGRGSKRHPTLLHPLPSQPHPKRGRVSKRHPTLLHPLPSLPRPMNTIVSLWPTKKGLRACCNTAWAQR
jgi:hypothetical protein